MNRTNVDEQATALYGEPLGRAEGVVHVTAVAKVDGALHVMRIGPAPKSRTDFFALELTRARVDAIVVTGSVLRAEPGLRYDLSPRLSAWRIAAGLTVPPLLLVLTRRPDLPAAHPVWASEARPLVFTGRETARTLRTTLPARVEVVGVDAPSGRAALDHLREERGCRAVSIEAGPAVAVPLYDTPSVVDEVVLSVFEGELPTAARGGRYLEQARLSAAFERTGGPTRIDERSGPWVFSRWRRAGR